LLQKQLQQLTSSEKKELQNLLSLNK